MMTKIFVLEDSLTRIDWFQSKWGIDNVIFTDNPISALNILNSNVHFDVIFLDHDLGGGPYERGVNGDGIDLANWMAEQKIHCDTPIVVHSLNVPGSENIMNALKNTHKHVHRIDFISLKYQLKGFDPDTYGNEENT